MQAIILNTGNPCGAIGPVSYTHLDVYKRQALVFDEDRVYIVSAGQAC